MQPQTLELTKVLAELVILAPIGIWTMNLVKNITSKRYNAAITQVVSLAVFYVICLVVAQADHLTLGSAGNPLALLSAVELLLVAWCLAAVGGFGHDFLRARNNADSSTLPTLTNIPDGNSLPPNPPPPN